MSDNNELPTPEDSQEPKRSLGVAGQMAKSFIHSPLSLLLFFAMLGMGILGLILTPRQEDPQISVPMVDIFVPYPGASAEQVGSLAIEPLQRIMSEIPDVKHVYGVASRGEGMVTIEFKVGQELEKSVFKVHDKLQSNLYKAPPGVPQPIVKPKGIDDVPTVAVTMWSLGVDDGALRTLAQDVLQNIKEIPNTGQGFVVGGRAEQVQIEIMPERLSGFGIGLDQVANTIRTANSETSAGSVESGNGHFTVYTGSFLRGPRDIENLVVGMHNEQPVYVRDVARVFQGPEEVKQIAAYYSGPSYRYDMPTDEAGGKPQEVVAAPAVTVAIAKKVGTNGVTVANAVLKRIEELKGHLIPDNVHVEVTRNYGQSADDKVNDLIKKLFIATGAVTILVLFSLGIRPAVVVTLVIPVVILITVFSAFVLGFTIDRVSLFALIFSIGILVDDAIVVIENIYRRWLAKGETDTDTAVDAVREVGNPTILATFTVVAALLPMGFVRGMMGPYMMPIPALGSVAMIFSLIAAFIFTPWLAMKLKPSMAKLHKDEEKEHRFDARMEKLFRRILTPLLNSRVKGWLFLFSLVVLFFAAMSMFYFKSVQVKMLPLDNKPEFNVFIDMPEGTSLPTTANLTHQLAEKLREIPEVTALQTYVGTSQPFDFNGMVRHYYLRDKPWQADIHVQLTDKKDRPSHRKSHHIATEARRMLKELVKDSPAKVTVVEMPPGPPVLQSVVAEVYGPDDATRREVAQKLTEVFETAKIIDDVDNYMSEPHAVWHFQVDTEKAVRRGISVDAINRNLSMAMGDYKLGDVKFGKVLEPTYIVMQVPLHVRSQLSRLYDLPIPTMDGGNTVPLAELGRFVKVPQDPLVYYKDLRKIEYVVGDSVGLYEGDNKYSLNAPIYGMMEVMELLEGYSPPDTDKLRAEWLITPPEGTESAFEWTGEWTVTYETFRDMGLAFAVALVLIYILVVWQFGNFLVPAIIMAPIPLTLLGIVPGHWFFNAEFTATSMIGWIALAGIIVRNSILLVDYSIQEVQQGTPIQDAVILACKTRTRPIMITAFALVLGSMVILFDPIFQGMAISLLFGVMVSTILTLIVIPLGCISAGTGALVPELKDADLDAPTAGGSGSSVAESGVLGRLWAKLIDLLAVVFYLIRAVFVMLFMALKGLWGTLSGGHQAPPSQTPPPASPPPSAPSNSGAGDAAAPPPESSAKATPSEAKTETKASVVKANDKATDTREADEDDGAAAENDAENSKPTRRTPAKRSSKAVAKGGRGIRLKSMDPDKDDTL